MVAQFCNAGAAILDKFLLTKRFPRPAVLTFWTAVANLFGLFFIFWGFTLYPGARLLILALFSGVAFTIALQFYYVAMKTGEASHIGPLAGGIVPVASIILSYFVLGERLAGNQIMAVALLVIGALLISFEKSRRHSGMHIGMLWAVCAGIFFGLAYVLSRAVYLEETFSTGFVWGRIGCFIAVIPFLFSRAVRRELFAKSGENKEQKKAGLILLGINKTLAALYFVGMNFAISLASATVVNALAGLQYAILFILIFIFSKTLPKFFKEQFTRKEIAQEISAILLIIVGLAFLVI